MRDPDGEVAVRETYRHGDLRRVLIEAGLRLARTGGPDAVVLREATRQAGVVPNAAYRHFANRDDLMHAVRTAALETLAAAIERDIRAIDPSLAPADVARAQLRAVGQGYLAFAAAEPGLFRTAFVITTVRPPPPGQVPTGGPNPYKLLGSALDAMVASGILPAARRPGAEILAWSTVHGLATLMNDGPLADLDPAYRAELGDRLVAMVERGL